MAVKTPSEIQVEVLTTVDIVTARQRGREFAKKLGFSDTEVTFVTAAISEIARNILDHANSGVVIISEVKNGPKRGLQVEAKDEGPGIPDVNLAMEYGYSARQGLGVGLPGVKWLMDNFEIVTKEGEGTTVKLLKWLKDDEPRTFHKSD